MTSFFHSRAFFPRFLISITSRARQRFASTIAEGTASASNSSLSVVVQKYGGTSLGTPEKLEKVVNIVRQWHNDKSRVVAVVSALSSATKGEGTTSCLLQAAEAASQNKEFYEFLDKIENTHLEILYRMLRTPSIRQDVRNFVVNELKTVRAFCESLTVIRELSPRSHDLIIGCGERLAAGVVSGVLRENNIPSVHVNLSNVFPDGLDTERPGYHVQARNAIQGVLVEPMKDTKVVPVVTGFLGHILGGIVAGVGRGYSDLTAALTAVALNANALQVWKESDGVFTGNPTKIPKARLLHHVSPREAAELTYFGNEVLHPFTMECAIEANIPIHILNTFKPNSPGTIIDPRIRSRQSPAKSKGVVAVCSKRNITVLNLSSNRMLGSTSFLAKVFELYAKHKVKADLISITEANLSSTIHESVPVSRISALIDDLKSLGQCSVETERAIISCIGEGMKHTVGVAAQMFSCLSIEGISFEMITQGASEINVAVVIDQKDCDRAIALIHKTFLEDNDPTESK